MILESIFGLSLVLNVSLDSYQPAPPDPAAWLQMSVRQKDAALLPLVRRATACIVGKVVTDPHYKANLRADEINDLIVELDLGLRAPGAGDDRRARPHVWQWLGRGFFARTLSRRAAVGGGAAGPGQDAGALAASAGRSTSVIGSVSSTMAATTTSADGTPTASPSNP